MTDRVVPMIHVPDVAATVDWYRNIGFTVAATYGHNGEGLSFAVLAFGDTEVMFIKAGVPASNADAKSIFTFTPTMLKRFTNV